MSAHRATSRSGLSRRRNDGATRAVVDAAAEPATCDLHDVLVTIDQGGSASGSA